MVAALVVPWRQRCLLYSSTEATIKIDLFTNKTHEQKN